MKTEFVDATGVTMIMEYREPTPYFSYVGIWTSDDNSSPCDIQIPMPEVARLHAYLTEVLATQGPKS